MRINGLEFNAELGEILAELTAQLRINNIPLLAKQKETSTHYQVTCPYHSNGMERRPSAGIRKSDGKFHCFACGEVHELNEVISHCFGYVDDVLGKFGWDWLLKNFMTISVEERKDVQLDFSRDTVSNSANNENNRLDNNNSNEFVTEEELDKYRFIHPYMFTRKLTEEIIELFDIGVDIEQNCITFPNLDKKGNCLFVARRSINGKNFYYPRDVKKQLYGIYQLYQLPVFPSEVFVCESMIDCCLLWKNKKPACALNGLGNEIQIRQLIDMPCRKIILATDMDKSGQDARVKLRKKLQGYKIITEVVLPFGRKDIGECSDEEIKNLYEVF